MIDFKKYKLGNREHFVTEIDLINSGHTRYFSFPLPDVREKDFYKTVRAFNAFFNGFKKRNRNGKKFLYAQKDFIDFDICKEFAGYFYGDKPLLKLNSIWEFFKAIGFDNKTKKWSR